MGQVCSISQKEQFIERLMGAFILWRLNGTVENSLLDDAVSKSADEHILSMDENAWFYDQVKWYDGDYDDGEYLDIDFVDIENPDYITIKLSVYESPIPNVDLAVLNDFDYSKLTREFVKENSGQIYTVINGKKDLEWLEGR